MPGLSLKRVNARLMRYGESGGTVITRLRRMREASVTQVSSTRPSAPLSSTFLVLIAAFLFCAVWMLYRPDHARLLVFPFVLTGFLIALCLHEFGHAIVAYYCGDTTVREKGYLTLDPLRYSDLQYSILFPILVMAIGGVGLPGGAVYINTLLLRRRIYGALVSAGGPLADRGGPGAADVGRSIWRSSRSCPIRSSMRHWRSWRCCR